MRQATISPCSPFRSAIEAVYRRPPDSRTSLTSWSDTPLPVQVELVGLVDKLKGSCPIARRPVVDGQGTSPNPAETTEDLLPPTLLGPVIGAVGGTSLCALCPPQSLPPDGRDETERKKNSIIPFESVGKGTPRTDGSAAATSASSTGLSSTNTKLPESQIQVLCQHLDLGGLGVVARGNRHKVIGLEDGLGLRERTER